MADTSLLWDTVAAVLLIVGASLSFIAGVGLTVLPDLLTRIHAAAKPQVLGLLCMLLAEAPQAREAEQHVRKYSRLADLQDAGQLGSHSLTHSRLLSHTNR